MRRLLFICLLFICTTAFSQSYTCPQFEQDLASWQSLAKKYKKNGNKTWAKMASQTFKLNQDKCIEYKYIIQGKDSFNIADMEDYLANWIQLEFRNSQPFVDKINHNIEVKGILRGVGRHIGFYSATTINSELTANITLKEDRMRIVVKIPHYILGAANLGGIESQTKIIGDCYPFNEKGDHKDSYAMAYINLCANAFGKVDSLLKFLNEHTKDVSSGDDENW